MSLGPISHAVEVDAPPQLAFDLFTQRLGSWWPIAYTFFGPDFADAAIDPTPGGRWFERNLQGQEVAWGEVRVYEPPHRLGLTFAIGADRKPTSPAHASQVEVRFDAVNSGTRVEVRHWHFEHHGDDAQAMRAGMDSAQGWPTILAELRRAAAFIAARNHR